MEPVRTKKAWSGTPGFPHSDKLHVSEASVLMDRTGQRIQSIEASREAEEVDEVSSTYHNCAFF